MPKATQVDRVGVRPITLNLYFYSAACLIKDDGKHNGDPEALQDPKGLMNHQRKI